MERKAFQDVTNNGHWHVIPLKEHRGGVRSGVTRILYVCQKSVHFRQNRDPSLPLRVT